MTLELSQQTIKIHLLLPNISRSKSNQTMEFGQVIEDNKRNGHLENSASASRHRHRHRHWHRHRHSNMNIVFYKI